MKTPAPDRRLYFFYGCHLNPLQIVRCCTAPVVVRRAALTNYALAFFGYATRWDGAEESLLPTPGATSWGVLYELAGDDAERLDVAQGIRFDGEGRYFHYLVEVTTADGKVHEALAYVRNTHGEARLPSREYLEYIAAGARGHQLPADYVARLLDLPSQPASYPVPRKRTLRDLVTTESACCC